MGIEESPNSLKFPPGFRFHPYDDELITHYLQNRVTSRPLPAPIMADIDLYKYDPWELPEKALFGEEEWYFFSPRERKYPNGARPNRAAGSGYWKATGTDRPILSGSKIVGVKKALVFYMGRPPQGIKTGWIMSEYRLLDTATKPSRLKGSMRLDDCVLCRVRQKGSMSRNFETQERPGKELEKCLPKLEEACPADPRCHAEIIADFLKKDCRLLASLLAGQAPSMENVSCVSHNTGNNCSPVNEDGSHKANAEMVIPSFGGNNPLKRKASEEGMYDYLLPCNKKLNSISVLEDIPLSKTLPQINMIYHNQSLAEGGFYDADSSDPIASPLELNELSFDSECLQ